MAESFGGWAGVLDTQKAEQQGQLAKLAMAKEQLSIQLTRQTLQQQQQLSQIAQSIPSTASMSDWFTSVAQQAAGKGLVMQAGEVANQGATLSKSQAEARDKQISASLKEASWWDSQLDTVDPSSDAQTLKQQWAIANLKYASTFGRPSPYSRIPADPQLLKQLKDSIGMTKDRAQTLQAISRAAADNALTKQREFNTDVLGPSKKAALDSLAAARAKTGAKAPAGYEWDEDEDEPKLKPIPGGPADPESPSFKGSGMSAYGARFAQRVIAAGTEGIAQLATISRLGSNTGIPTQGLFKNHVVGDSATSSVSQSMTTSQQKMYNAALAGLAPELASAQNQGLAPNEAQIDNVRQQLSIYPTDSKQVAQFKVALLARDFRKAIEGGFENMKPAQQRRAQELIEQFKVFPDPDVIQNAKPGDNMFPAGAFGAKGVEPVDKQVGGKLPKVQSEKDWEALKTGEEYIDPAGKRRVKGGG